jgi:hypothetical protein
MQIGVEIRLKEKAQVVTYSSFKELHIFHNMKLLIDQKKDCSLVK